jgi:hypothetical protein
MLSRDRVNKNVKEYSWHQMLRIGQAMVPIGVNLLQKAFPVYDNY